MNSEILEIRNVRVVTATGSHPMARCGIKYFDGNIRIKSGKILSIDEDAKDAEKIFDGKGMIAIPGFVDPHTHIPFTGERSHEFIMRATGQKYSEILSAGGGIHSTVNNVRSATIETLAFEGLKHAGWLLKNGVTTFECKSGYGLDLPNELKQLKAMRMISEYTPQRIVPTFLGAHAIPPCGEEKYIELLKKMLDHVRAESLSEFVDIFCDEGAFSVEGSKEFLKYAKSMGFKIKAHAEELSLNGFGSIASELGATSVDHLAMCSEEEMKVLAKNKTVAVLLPLTSFYLKNPYAPARRMIDDGVAVALGSDFNPGSNTFYSPFLTIHLAVNHLGMTPEEAFVAHTLNAACALDMGKWIGTIEVGKYADITILDAPTLDYIPYMPTEEIVRAVFINGVKVFENRNYFSR